MRILHGLADLKAEILRPILTIGNFDGVHLGHRAIFQRVIQRAQAVGGTSVALTFDPHPLKVLRPDQAPPLITTFEEKMKLLDELGLQVAISLPFTAEFSALSARQFVEEILLKRTGIRELCIGYDFAFGQGRAGTIASLREMGARLGFEVTTVGPVFLEGQVVSSSLIRSLIQQGEVQEAARLLGRPYSLEGIRDMGDVSATRLLPQKELLPSSGLYAIKILHRPGISPVETDLTHLCHIPSPQDHCPPWLYLLEVPGEVEGESWEIAFLQRLEHRDEGIAAGCPEVDSKRMGLLGESHSKSARRSGGNGSPDE